MNTRKTGVLLVIFFLTGCATSGPTSGLICVGSMAASVLPLVGGPIALAGLKSCGMVDGGRGRGESSSDNDVPPNVFCSGGHPATAVEGHLKEIGVKLSCARKEISFLAKCAIKDVYPPIDARTAAYLDNKCAE